MVGFLAVQSKGRILFINLPYFPKGEEGGGEVERRPGVTAPYKIWRRKRRKAIGFISNTSTIKLY